MSLGIVGLPVQPCALTDQIYRTWVLPKSQDWQDSESQLSFKDSSPQGSRAKVIAVDHSFTAFDAVPHLTHSVSKNSKYSNKGMGT